MRDIRIGKLFMGAINKDLRSDIENNNIYGCTLVMKSISGVGNLNNKIIN